jgi:uncharacterized protein (TIGR03382 family)
MFWVTLGSCGGGLDGGDLDLQSSVSEWRNQSGSVLLEINRLPAFNSVDGGCPGATIDVTHRVCAAASFGSPLCNPGTSLRSNALVHFKSIPPNSPVITSVGSSDQALIVRVSVSSDTATFRVEYRPNGTDSGTASWTQAGPFPLSGGTGTTRINGLQNNVRHEIRAFAQDAANNESLPSDSFFATPYQTQGFFAQYQSSGGAETGGCASVGGTISMALLGLALLSIAGSRRWR